MAVEKLNQYSGRKKLQEKIPIFVEKMMMDHNLMTEYEMLVQDVVTSGWGKLGWSADKVQPVLNEYRHKFEAKGVTLHLSLKKEYVSHGQYGGHVEVFRWIEFVDMKEQPNYHPQHNAEERKDGCIIS